MAYSYVTTKANILKESKVRSDVGNRMKATFHSPSKSREQQL